MTLDGQLSHEGIVECTHVINSWLVQTLRLFAQAAARASNPWHREAEAPLQEGADPVLGAHAAVLGGPPMSLINDVRTQWRLLDQIHEGASLSLSPFLDASFVPSLTYMLALAGIRRMQELLVHLEYMPSGCSRDKCADQHLRFITRLDLDLLVRSLSLSPFLPPSTSADAADARPCPQNCFFLLHSLVTENLGLDHLTGDNAVIVYAESDKRIRKALKLIAFYLEVRARSSSSTQLDLLKLTRLLPPPRPRPPRSFLVFLLQLYIMSRYVLSSSSSKSCRCGCCLGRA